MYLAALSPLQPHPQGVEPYPLKPVTCFWVMLVSVAVWVQCHDTGLRGAGSIMSSCQVSTTSAYSHDLKVILEKYQQSSKNWTSLCFWPLLCLVNSPFVHLWSFVSCLLVSLCISSLAVLELREPPAFWVLIKGVWHYTWLCVLCVCVKDASIFVVEIFF